MIRGTEREDEHALTGYPEEQKEIRLVSVGLLARADDLLSAGGPTERMSIDQQSPHTFPLSTPREHRLIQAPLSNVTPDGYSPPSTSLSSTVSFSSASTGHPQSPSPRIKTALFVQDNLGCDDTDRTHGANDCSRACSSRQQVLLRSHLACPILYRLDRSPCSSLLLRAIVSRVRFVILNNLHAGMPLHRRR